MKNSDLKKVYSDLPERLLDISAIASAIIGVITAISVFKLIASFNDMKIEAIIATILIITDTVITYAVLRAIANILRCKKYQAGLYINEFEEDSTEHEEKEY